MGRQESQDPPPVAQAPLHNATVRDHLFRDRDDLPRPEIEAPIELLGASRDLGTEEMGIRQGAHLRAALVDQRLPREPSVGRRLTKQLRPRYGAAMDTWIVW